MGKNIIKTGNMFDMDQVECIKVLNEIIEGIKTERAREMLSGCFNEIAAFTPQKKIYCIKLAILAMEKQVPAEFQSVEFGNRKEYVCPKCESYLVQDKRVRAFKYCPYCGQAIIQEI